WPAPSYVLHRVCEWHSLALGTLPEFPRPRLPAWGCPCGYPQNPPANASPKPIGGPWALPQALDTWRRPPAALSLPDAAWRCPPPRRPGCRAQGDTERRANL